MTELPKEPEAPETETTTEPAPQGQRLLHLALKLQELGEEPVPAPDPNAPPPGV